MAAGPMALLDHQSSSVIESKEVGLGHFVDVDVLGIPGVVDQVVEPLASPALQGLVDISNETVKGRQIAGVEAKRRCLLSSGFDFANKGNRPRFCSNDR